MISIKWLWQSWFQIKSGHNVIYIDPAYLSLNSYFKPENIENLSKNLEKGNLVLITHNHMDHCNKNIINDLKYENTVILAPKSCVDKIGGGVTVVKTGDELKFNDIIVKVVDAYTTGLRKFHVKGECVGYVLTVDNKRIYHAGDTDFIPEMKNLGMIDIALIPIGGIFTMDIKEAVKAVSAINPKIVIPMHILASNPEDFKKELSMNNVKVVLLRDKESFEY
ncbi:L-ascorbate-6-phosphate lactonase UlaG [Candidatus Tiddalikarchaeum anstoanum]|nr:L-ascorbate-6-phosphate lactonase UlaG [Candidatus Tiddalikarchaeum anstoanum]